MGKVKDATSTAAPAVVVFGLDEGSRPHAAWFAEADAELARKAAAMMGMSILPVTTDEHREAALAVAAGRVFASGKGFVPFVKAAAYDRLQGFAEAFKPEPHEAAGQPAPIATELPASFADIGLGSLVLAADGESPGWFEAVCVETKGDVLALRWVAWPDLPVFVRRKEHLSLLSPAAHEAAAAAV